MTEKNLRRPPSKTLFLVVWWMSKNPYAAVFENRIAAEAAANVRNAILIRFRGQDTQVEQVVDWYRRDDEGRPMPAEWRELMGQIRAPWFAKPKPAVEAIDDLSSPTAETAEA